MLWETVLCEGKAGAVGGGSVVHASTSRTCFVDNSRHRYRVLASKELLLEKRVG